MNGESRKIADQWIELHCCCDSEDSRNGKTVKAFRQNEQDSTNEKLIGILLLARYEKILKIILLKLPRSSGIRSWEIQAEILHPEPGHQLSLIYIWKQAGHGAEIEQLRGS